MAALHCYLIRTLFLEEERNAKQLTQPGGVLEEKHLLEGEVLLFIFYLFFIILVGQVASFKAVTCAMLYI